MVFIFGVGHWLSAGIDSVPCKDQNLANIFLLFFNLDDDVGWDESFVWKN